MDVAPTDRETIAAVDLLATTAGRLAKGDFARAYRLLGLAADTFAHAVMAQQADQEAAAERTATLAAADASRQLIQAIGANAANALCGGRRRAVCVECGEPTMQDAVPLDPWTCPKCRQERARRIAREQEGVDAQRSYQRQRPVTATGFSEVP